MASSRSSSPSLAGFNLRPSLLLKALIILGLLITVISFSYWNHLAVLPPNVIHRKPLASEDFQFDIPTGQNWTHRIWQTSRHPVAALSEEEREHVRSWSELNPEYRHEVLTDEMMEEYVRDHFHFSHPDIEQVYFDVKDYILRSDLIRYLILLTDGGVYNDLDVGCEKSINTWVPRQYKDDAGIVLGVEVDNKFGPDGRTFQGGTDLFQLVNWTIMSKPNQPFMWFLLNRVMENIKKLAASQDELISEMTFSIQDVLDVTGPAALTRAFFEYASDITSSNVTYRNFTKMSRPRLIGEVVILPIQAFGAGHQVEWAGMEKDGSELVHHYFAGSWKTDHYNKAPEASSEDDDTEKTGKAKGQEEGQNKEAIHIAIEKAMEQAKAQSKKLTVGEVTLSSGMEVEGDGKQSEAVSASDKSDPAKHTDNIALNPSSHPQDLAGNEPVLEQAAKVKAEKDAEAEKLAEAEAKVLEEKMKEKEAEQKAQAEKEAQQEEKSEMTQEEKEAEDRKQKWEEIKAVAPKEAKPKSDEKKQMTSNNLADYDFQPD